SVLPNGGFPSATERNESSVAMIKLHSVTVDDQNEVVDHLDPETPPASPKLPNQALAGRKPKLARSAQRVRRQRTSRALPISVLVVDDVADVTEMIGLFLKHAGYEVATADSAAAALKIAGEKRFDLIISDIGMPEMNGYELAETLRTSLNYQGVPIIAVTGYSEYDDRGRALQAGFNSHLTKPIDPERLLSLMKDLLG